MQYQTALVRSMNGCRRIDLNIERGQDAVHLAGKFLQSRESRHPVGEPWCRYSASPVERQRSWSIDRQHTVHEGPCAPSVSDFVLSASPDSCNPEISHARGFRGIGACFHLQST